MPQPAANTKDTLDHYPRHMVGNSVMTPDQPLVPIQYGTRNIPLGGGAGGWTMAAPDYAKVLGAFDRGASNPLFLRDPVGTTKNMWTVYPDGTGVCRGWFSFGTTDAAGNAVTAYTHNGEMEGTSAYVMHRSDGVSFVLLLNSDSGLSDQTTGRDLSGLANKVTTWPTTDLFPSVGIPSFK